MALNHRIVTSVALSVAFLLAGCGGGGQGTEPAVTVVPGAPASAVAAPAPAPTSAPASTATAGTDAEAEAARRASAPLPRLDLSDMGLWHWNGKWHASEWGNNFSQIPYKYDHIVQRMNGDTVFTLDAAGAPELQALNGTPSQLSGLWEADVTLPKLKDGLVVAPLWLYDQASRDEIDFEYAGRRGLDVTMHVNVNGQMHRDSVRLFAGSDMSGQRHRFGIRVDQKAGTIEMYFDGRLVHRWRRSDMGAVFVSRPVKPWISMWAANPNDGGFNYWLGQWQGLAPNEKLTMTVHGYNYTGGL